jgi:DNA replication protein DnaC
MESRNCRSCGVVLGEGRSALCDPCDRRALEKQAEIEQREIADALAVRFRISRLPVAYVNGSRSLESIPDAYRAQVELADLLGSEECRGLFLYGPSRSYKTSLACASLAKAIRAGGWGMFVPTVDLMTDIQRGYKDQDFESRGEIVETIVSTPRLVLDDFGQEKASHHAGECIRQILDRRWQTWKPGRWTIVTTNLAPEELCNRFDESHTGTAILHRLAVLTVAVEMSELRA